MFIVIWCAFLWAVCCISSGVWFALEEYALGFTLFALSLMCGWLTIGTYNDLQSHKHETPYVKHCHTRDGFIRDGVCYLPQSK